MLRLAVLLATYNGEKYISEQLDSLVRQTYSKFVCYIHDDGSKDDTVKICEEYEARYPEIFKILRYDASKGAKNNFFSLMKRVEADIYMFCDQDDVWLPHKIEEMINAIKDVDEDFVAFSDLKIVDEQLRVLEESFYRATHVETEKINYKNALVKGFIPGCTMMTNRRVIEKALQYHNIENIKMHDWWLLLIALITDSKLIFVDKTLGLYRQHSSNTIGVKNQSTTERVIFNVKRVVNGTLRAEKKKNLSSPRSQALELYETGIGDKTKRMFVKEFALIGRRSKIGRVTFYLRNFKDVYRMWWMAIWA